MADGTATGRRITGLSAIESFALAEDLAAEAPDPAADPGTRRPPVLIFLVPGIRSSRRWAHQVQAELRAEAFAARRFEAFVVSPYDRLSSLHVVLRFGLGRMRREVQDQILARAAEFPASPVNVVCHSMGSVLFADVADAVRVALSAGGRSRIDKIVFLGSICHRNRGRTLYEACGRPPGEVYNDVGTRDPLPLVAHAIHPWHYGTVGAFGFGMTYVTDRFYDLDHRASTEAAHLNENVLPLILDNLRLVPLRLPPLLIDPNHYTYLRYAAAAALALLGGVALWGLWAAL